MKGQYTGFFFLSFNLNVYLIINTVQLCLTCLLVITYFSSYVMRFYMHHHKAVDTQKRTRHIYGLTEILLENFFDSC